MMGLGNGWLCEEGEASLKIFHSLAAWASRNGIWRKGGSQLFDV